MKRNLKSIAAKLSDADIQELIQLKKMGDKKTVALIRKRDRLAAKLADLDAEIAKIEGRPAAKRRGRPAKGQPGRRPGRSAKRGRKPGNGGINFSAAVREVFAKAGEPLRAKQVVEKLGEVGVTVTDPSDARKRVSIVLAQHKKYFEQVERGVYRLRENTEAGE